MLWIFVVSNASSSVSGGRMVASLRASIDLPVPGRPDQQQVMPSGGGDFQRPLHTLLPFHLREIHLLIVHLLEEPRHIDRSGSDDCLALQKIRGLAQVPDRDHLQTRHHGRFGRVIGRHQQPRLALRPRPQSDGQDPFDWPHCSSWLVATAPSTSSARRNHCTLSGYAGILQRPEPWVNTSVRNASTSTCP